MPRMSGSEPRIEIFKPFGEAFQLMKKILFQPFELKKWLVIGFAAWLANLGAGGGGFGNFNYPNNRREGAQKFNEAISQIPQPVLITAICVLICVVLVLIVLFAWLRARGRFIFLDCIVRNRAAIVAPWKEFRGEGNSFFLFSLLVVLVVVPVIVIAGLVLIVPFAPGGDQTEARGIAGLGPDEAIVRRDGHPDEQTTSRVRLLGYSWWGVLVSVMSARISAEGGEIELRNATHLLLGSLADARLRAVEPKRPRRADPRAV